MDYKDRFEQYFYFFDSLSNPVTPTSVIINNNLAEHPTQGFCNMPINGTDFTWTVLGNLNIPSFTDTVTAIQATAVNYPAPDTTIINKSNGITINHGVFNNAGSYIFEIICGHRYYVEHQVIYEYENGQRIQLEYYKHEIFPQSCSDEVFMVR